MLIIYYFGDYFLSGDPPVGIPHHEQRSQPAGDGAEHPPVRPHPRGLVRTPTLHHLRPEAERLLHLLQLHHSSVNFN